MLGSKSEDTPNLDAKAGASDYQKESASHSIGFFMVGKQHTMGGMQLPTQKRPSKRGEAAKVLVEDTSFLS
jgi:hypothetical protein